LKSLGSPKYPKQTSHDDELQPEDELEEDDSEEDDDELSEELELFLPQALQPPIVFIFISKEDERRGFL
jgi:hypothetical protein